jgi:hypothetical protein
MYNLLKPVVYGAKLDVVIIGKKNSKYKCFINTL